MSPAQVAALEQLVDEAADDGAMPSLSGPSGASQLAEADAAADSVRVAELVEMAGNVGLPYGPELFDALVNNHTYIGDVNASSGLVEKSGLSALIDTSGGSDGCGGSDARGGGDDGIDGIGRSDGAGDEKGGRFDAGGVAAP